MYYFRKNKLVIESDSEDADDQDSKVNKILKNLIKLIKYNPHVKLVLNVAIYF